MTVDNASEIPIETVFVPVDCNSIDGTLQFVNIMALGDVSVGARVHAYRRRKGWSRMDLSRRSGVDLCDVKMAEVQPNRTSIGVFIRLCEALRISINDLTEEALVELRVE